jgi:hypothetical protein
MPQQTRHVASEPSPEARANVQAVLQGNVWRRHDIPDEYYWESPGMGWSSLLCMGKDSNGCGCVGKRSNRHPRCLSNGMNGRKREGTVEICAVGRYSAVVSRTIRRESKCPATLRRKSEEAIL